MTCKDCLGDMFCSKQDKKKRVDKYCADADEVCKYFKNKSRIIELPKIIWVISECLELEEYEVLGVFTTNNSIWLDTKGNKQQLLMQISNYNKTWFTDKAKAEAKLKELNNETTNQ